MITINYRNRLAVEELHIHDSQFTGYSYDYDLRTVHLSCENIFHNKRYSFTFRNVIALHLQSCSFWHGGNSILWVDVSDSHEYLQQLEREQMHNAEKYQGSYLDQGIQYIVVEFALNSGDALVIVCQDMLFNDA